MSRPHYRVLHSSATTIAKKCPACTRGLLALGYRINPQHLRNRIHSSPHRLKMKPDFSGTGSSLHSQSSSSFMHAAHKILTLAISLSKLARPSFATASEGSPTNIVSGLCRVYPTMDWAYYQVALGSKTVDDLRHLFLRAHRVIISEFRRNPTKSVLRFLRSPYFPNERKNLIALCHSLYFFISVSNRKGA